MAKKDLFPRNSCWIPTRESRAICRQRVTAAQPSQFKSYQDYFFFLHIDPVLRFWHTIGMFAGVAFFVLLVLNWTNWYWNVGFYLLGVLFFYGFGILSHYAYDGGAAKTVRKHFLDSTPTVIYINLLTVSFLYQKRLCEFVREYPFTVTAYDLVPKEEWRRPHAARSPSQP
jgi:hypothetical protein